MHLLKNALYYLNCLMRAFMDGIFCIETSAITWSKSGFNSGNCFNKLYKACNAVTRTIRLSFLFCAQADKTCQTLPPSFSLSLKRDTSWARCHLNSLCSAFGNSLSKAFLWVCIYAVLLFVIFSTASI